MEAEKEFLREIDSGNLLSVLPYYRDFLLEGGREGESLAWDLVGEKGWTPFHDLNPRFRHYSEERWFREGGARNYCWSWWEKKVPINMMESVLPFFVFSNLTIWEGAREWLGGSGLSYSEWPTRLRAFQELVLAIQRSRT